MKDASTPNPNYKSYKEIFAGKQFPLAYVDMALLDENIRQICLRAGNTPVRIASKSIRCTAILRYILDSNPQFRGIMSFSGPETVYLSQNGFDNILLAYPETDPLVVASICRELNKAKDIVLMTDRPEHLQILNDMGSRHDVQVPVCIDIDMSVDFPGLHFGVWRSSLRTSPQLKLFLEELKKYEHVKLVGVMGYEAQIAGVADQVKGQWVMNKIIGSLKKASVPSIAGKRQAAVKMIREAGYDLKIVNGGGTGSVETTVMENDINEITVGSGFYNSHLFDNYRQFHHRPAAGFACVINRHPGNQIYTCAGGGYVASGSAEPIKLPLPYLPEGSHLMKNEGAGEVQTPVKYSGPEKLAIGDPIFFRHSKAGELCERFNELHMIRDSKIEQIVPTYRGEGQCFL